MMIVKITRRRRRRAVAFGVYSTQDSESSRKLVNLHRSHDRSSCPQWNSLPRCVRLMFLGMYYHSSEGYSKGG